jgi:enoyl-CoA hydratase/carnithine racemase
MLDKPRLLFEIDERVALLTLNHPEKRNALSREMLESLRDAWSKIAGDKTVKVVILRASGPVFCAGHDLRELSGATPDDTASLFSLCTQMMEQIRILPQPVIAQVQGLATAAGCQLAATCDLVVAAEEATFATPGVKIGLFCTTPAVPLCRAISTKKSLEMLFTGLPLTAHDALAGGLVNRVVPAGQLAAETLSLARQIAGASGYTLALGKRAFYEQLPLDRPDAYAVAEGFMVENAAAPDAQEGIRAFLEKRLPQWEN